MTEDRRSTRPTSDARARTASRSVLPPFEGRRPPRKRRCAWLIVPACVLVAAVVALAVGVPIATTRLRAAIEARCGAAVGGRCDVGGLSLARDGALASNVRLHSRVRGVSGSVDAISLAFGWWSLVTGQTQGIAVRIAGVTLTDDAAFDDVLAELRRLRAARHDEPHRSRARLDRLVIERVNARATLGALVATRVQDAGVEWTRDGPMELSWRDAVVTVGPLDAVSTGRCTLRHDRDPDVRVAVECDGVRARVDLDDAAAQLDALSAIARAARDAWVPVAGATGVPGAPAVAEAPPTITVHARDADVSLTRAGEPIVGLRPGTVSLTLERGALREAHVRFGDGADGPAIETDVVLTDVAGVRRWRADVAGDALPLREIVRWLPAIPWHATDHGLAHVRFHAEPDEHAAGVVVVDGEAALRDFGLAHHGLAHDPIDGLSASVRGAARVDLPRRHVETEGVQLEVNGVVVALAGWAEHAGGRTALDASLRLPSTDCDAIRMAVPANVAGPVRDLAFDGRIAADVHLALATDALAATQFEIDVDNRCRVVRDSMALGMRRLGAPFVQRVQEPAGLRAFVTGPGSAAWVPLANIAPYMAHAVVSHEDGRFYRHHGFDPPEIRQAIIRDVGARRFVYGASTLSMQLAKNVFLQREKTLVRKLQEVVLTWYLEQSLDKDAILELYLNVVEFGPAIYGVGPASRFYFDREPRDLTPLQSIFLATSLPNPVARYAATFARGAVSPDALAHLRAYAHVMQLRGYLTPDEAVAAQSDPLAFRPANAPTHGSLTQDVEPATTDEMAGEMAPPPHDEETATVEPTEADGGVIVDGEPAAAPPPPVSLRTGGTL